MKILKNSKKIAGLLLCFSPVVVLSTGCSHLGKRGPVPLISELPAPNTPASPTISAEETAAEVSEYGEVPIMTNTQVRQWISYFQGRGRHHMERYLKRSTRYTKLMQEILRQKGLPEDLIYVPLIESGFNSTAHSHASAVGYWQFIRATGKRYGLRIDSFVDDRRDPVDSTVAAAEYYKSLYSLFGDWYLALAAYNVGENRVKSAVMRYNTRDFWELARRRKLPRETCNYVPKFLAASIIAKDPARFGFDNVDYSPELKFDQVEVTRPISLMTLAHQLKLPYAELKKMNPRYRSDFVPIYPTGPSHIRVPPGYYNAAVAALPQSYAAEPRVVVREHFYYRIRRGDTLSTIARRHRTKVSTLRALNNLSNRSILRVGQRIRVPERNEMMVRYNAQAEEEIREPQSEIKTAALVTEKSSSSSGAGGYFYYQVRQGDTLSEIAAKHGVSLAKLKRINGLSRRSLLRVDQKLKIPGNPTKTTSSSMRSRTHRVKRGENLTLIARRYNTSVSEIKKLNRISKAGKIFPGQRLVVGNSFRR